MPGSPSSVCGCVCGVWVQIAGLRGQGYRGSALPTLALANLTKLRAAEGGRVGGLRRGRGEVQGREREGPNIAVMSAVEVRKEFLLGGSQDHAGLNIFSMVFFSCET